MKDSAIWQESRVYRRSVSNDFFFFFGGGLMVKNDTVKKLVQVFLLFYL